MYEKSLTYLDDAAAKLEGMNGLLDRARDNAEDFHDEAQELQHAVHVAASLAHDLGRRMRAAGR